MAVNVLYCHGFAAIPYTVKVMTAEEKDAGTESSAWIQIYGKKKKSTGKLYLDFIQKKGFEPGSIETFSLEAVDVSDVKEIEVSLLGCENLVSPHEVRRKRN